MTSEVKKMTAGEYCDAVRKAFTSKGWLLLERESGFLQKRQSNWVPYFEKNGLATLMIRDYSPPEMKVAFSFTFDATGSDEEYANQLYGALLWKWIKYTGKEVSILNEHDYNMVKSSLGALVDECQQLQYQYLHGDKSTEPKVVDDNVVEEFYKIIRSIADDVHIDSSEEDGNVCIDIDPVDDAGYTMDLRVDSKWLYMKDKIRYIEEVVKALEYWRDDTDQDSIAVRLYQDNEFPKPLAECLEDAQVIRERIVDMAHDCRQFYNDIKK